MTGPEHYREAERALLHAANGTQQAADLEGVGESEAADIAFAGANHMVALAQAHATLALVAGTVNVYRDQDEQASWRAAVSS